MALLEELVDSLTRGNPGSVKSVLASVVYSSCSRSPG
jgi:hypothetical protein